MARAKATPKKEKEAVAVHSLALTPATHEILEGLSQDATDYTGRKVSGSAIVRALLRYAKRQGYEWSLAQLFPLVEEEMGSGMIWGKKK